MLGREDVIEVPLTPREWDCVRLVAKAYTNKQIAAELVLATPSIGRCLSVIYGKLGFERREIELRTAVVLWVQQNDRS